ncbi:MAG: hypothetical protein A3G18_12010 [Rhodospirillales bacterium RIFCSPLOWO2_12_FULL_58_28]|nr:MAG: hypothetical protein A3H92_09095 [Rhodospirillales bacterium RIFCSPLOWO2_02_FULL_58_16]OHC78166.1 MAG: hypothetical protein A3G18_12010 [Rhodospirillales bacterium RIFCSPLOWO2_12_FULL_58_28]
MSRSFLAKLLLVIFVCAQLVINAAEAVASDDYYSFDGSCGLIDDPSEGADLGAFAVNSYPDGFAGSGRKVVFFVDERLMAAKAVSGVFTTGPPIFHI